MESSAYSEMEIEGVRCKLRRQIEERTRATSGVLALFAAFDAMLVMTRSSVPVLIAMLAVEGLALYAAWYLQAGCLKRQFNKALRRGYPGFDHLKLRGEPPAWQLKVAAALVLSAETPARWPAIPEGYNPQNP